MRGGFARAKGQRGERLTANELKDMIPEMEESIRRGWQSRDGGKTESDVTGVPGFHFEVKMGVQPNPRAALRQAVADAGIQGLIPVCVIRDTREPPFVVMRWSDMLLLIREHGNVGKFLAEWRKRREDAKVTKWILRFKKKKH